ncbi:hypothetical protein ABIB62_001424 [Mucilaginibacter sp. UYP25]
MKKHLLNYILIIGCLTLSFQKTVGQVVFTSLPGNSSTFTKGAGSSVVYGFSMRVPAGGSFSGGVLNIGVTQGLNGFVGNPASIARVASADPTLAQNGGTILNSYSVSVNGGPGNNAFSVTSWPAFTGGTNGTTYYFYLILNYNSINNTPQPTGYQFYLPTSGSPGITQNTYSGGITVNNTNSQTYNFSAQIDWIGASGTANANWNNSANWSPATVPGTTDLARIGVVAFTKQPVVTATTQVGSVTFGTLKSSLTGTPDKILTVNGSQTLTVNGDINQISGTNVSIKSIVAGTGTITCAGNFNIGSTTQPSAAANNLVNISSQINQFNILGNILLSSQGNGGNGINYPAFTLDANKVSLTGQVSFSTLNSPTFGGLNNAAYQGIGIFKTDPGTSATTLELLNANAIATPIPTGFYVDFTDNGTGNGYTIYNKPFGTQTVYTSTTTGIGLNAFNYDNLTLSGASSKISGGGTLTIGNSFVSSGGAVDLNTNNPDITVGNSWTNTANVTQGSGDITLANSLQNNAGAFQLGAGNLTTTVIQNNAGTISGGAGPGVVTVTNIFQNQGGAYICNGEDLIMTGTTYTNSAASTFTAGTGTVFFNSGTAQSLSDVTTSGTTFNKVTFQGNGTKTMSGSGGFGVSSTGLLTVSAGSLAAGGVLTLRSDEDGAATVASMPTAASVTGTVKVERFLSGSPTSLARRGYRLMSSPVYAATVSGANVYDLNYLKNSSIVTGIGGSGNGFTTGTSTTANASIYLFREDLVPNNSSFAAGNFKGITQLNKTPAYNFGINALSTLTNANDASTYLPVGNGFMFFFRGNSTLNTTAQTGTKTTSPYDYPEDVTFTQSGTLNRGTIIVRPWSNGGTALLYSTGIANNVPHSDVRGYNLVGNPYAATINWEKFNRNGINSSIYGGNAAGTAPINTTIWQFNSTTKQYASYQPKATVTAADTTLNTVIPTGAVSSDGVVSNLISSGQGFFVIANAPGQTLTFRESAKVTSQAPAASVVTLMSTSLPRSGNGGVNGFMRLKLIKDNINTDAVALVLNSTNDANYKNTEDAVDLGGNGAQVSISAYSADDIGLSINRLPLPKLSPEIVPVSVDANTNGLFSLKIEALSGLPSIYQVWLMDSYKKDSLDMRAHDTYNFNIDRAVAETFGKTRFKLVIRQNPELALKLLDFTGTKVTAGVKLNWVAENEGNYTNYSVERSIDNGNTFEIVGGLHATGDGKYNITDATPVKGLNQYRLKQDDINGTITYSKVVDIMYADVEGITIKTFNVYPNPVSNTVNVSIINPATTATTYNIKISDGSGSLIKNAVSTQATWQANVGNLLPGTYFVQVVNNTTKAVIGNGKFIKL